MAVYSLIFLSCNKMIRSGTRPARRICLICLICLILTGIALVVIGVNINRENKYHCGDTEISSNIIGTYSNIVIFLGSLLIVAGVTMCIFYMRGIL